MSQSSIGKAALVLSADASAAKAALDKFITDTQKAMGQAAKHAEAAGGGRGGILGRVFGGAAIGGGVGAAIGAGIGFIEEQTAKVKELAAAGRQAAGLGIRSDQFIGLGLALKKVGIEGDGVSAVFAKLGRTSAAAADGDAGAATAMDRLGIAAKDIVGLPLDQQFLRVADAIKELPPGAQQAQAAMSVFGRSGYQLLPVLQKGSEGLQEFIEHEKKLGSAVSPEDMAPIREAAAATAKLHQTWEGFTTRVTVAAAPALAKLFDGISEGVEKCMPLFRGIGEAISTIGEISGAIYGEIFEAIKEVIDEVAGWITELFGLGGVHVSVRDTIIAVFRAIGTAYAYVWDTIRAGVGVVKVAFGEFLKILADVLAAVIDLAAKIPDSLRPAWVDKFLDGSRKVVGGAKQMGQDISNSGEAMIGSFGSSATQFNSWLDRITNRQKKSVEETADATVAEMESVTAALKADNAALVKGTAAEVSARAKFEFGGGSAQDKLLAEQRKGNGHLGNINRGVQELNKKTRPAEALLSL